MHYLGFNVQVMAVDLQLHGQRSTTLTVSPNMFEARPSGKRIFLLKDDIFRDFIFKQQPRETNSTLKMSIRRYIQKHM